MVYLYLACLLVSLGMLLWLKIFDLKNSITQYINLIIILITSLGYYFLATASNLGEATVAIKMTYFGGCFLPVFYFFLVLEICHVNISKFLSSSFVIIQCILYGCVCTIGRNGLYYKSISFKEIDGEFVFDKVYGPLHVFYPITMIVYLSGAIAATIYALKKKKAINKKSVIIMDVLCFLACAAYVCQKLSYYKYDFLPVALISLMLGALIPVYQHSVYAVYEKKDIINEQFTKVGFLSFDKKLYYQNSNEFMSKIFPELANYSVGKKIEDCSEELSAILDQIKPLEVNEKKDINKLLLVPLKAFWVNDRYYKGVVHVITDALGKSKGYYIEITDNTADRMIIEFKERYNEELSKEVDAKTLRIRTIQEKTILGMARMVESRDLSTGGHIMRTSDVVRIFANKLVDLSYADEAFLNLVIRSAPMHDIGKIGVDDAVLRKQGKFNDDEYEKMKKHSEIGYHMVKEILGDVEEPDFVRVAENVAHYHHEKVNGKGYPHGLVGDEIPVEARIMALADVFDALVSKRCYKAAFSCDKAFEIIKQDSGAHFDPVLAEIFISCRNELEAYYSNIEE